MNSHYHRLKVCKYVVEVFYGSNGKIWGHLGHLDDHFQCCYELTDRQNQELQVCYSEVPIIAMEAKLITCVVGKLTDIVL